MILSNFSYTFHFSDKATTRNNCSFTNHFMFDSIDYFVIYLVYILLKAACAQKDITYVLTSKSKRLHQHRCMDCEVNLASLKCTKTQCGVCCQCDVHKMRRKPCANTSCKHGLNAAQHCDLGLCQLCGTPGDRCCQTHSSFLSLSGRRERAIEHKRKKKEIREAKKWI